MNIKYSDLKKKDVVNAETGKNYGKISDLIIEEKNGNILKIIVPGKKNGFLCNDNVEIDYNCIIRIGDDAILFKESKPYKPPCPRVNCKEQRLNENTVDFLEDEE